MKKYIKDILIIFIGCLVIGISFNAFFTRYGMAPGGLSGLFVILNKILGVEIWILNLLFNIPLYIAAYKLLSKEECLKTLLGILFCSFAFKYTSFICDYNFTEDKMLACICGALLLGGGTGIIFKAKGSTGGTGLLGMILNRFFPRISTPKLMGVADGIIVFLSAVVDYKIETGLYSAIALLFVVIISDMLIKNKKINKEDVSTNI